MSNVAVVYKSERASYGGSLKPFLKHDFDEFFLCKKDSTKIFKKDVTLNLELLEPYEFVICIGSETAKHVGKITGGVMSTQGSLIHGKYIPLISPGMLSFKPETKAGFEIAIARTESILAGDVDCGVEVEGITEYSRALEYLKSIQGSDVIAVDSETSALWCREGEVLGICLSNDEKFGVYIDVNVIYGEVEKLMAHTFKTHKCVLHNGKFDIHWLRYHFNFEFSDWEDTMLLHYVLDENNPHGLKPLAIKYTKLGNYDQELDEFKKTYCKAHGMKQAEFSYDLIPFETMYPYAAKDAVGTLILYNKFRPLVARNANLEKVYTTLLIPGAAMLQQMEDNGVPINSTTVDTVYAELDREIQADVFNLNKYPEITKFKEVYEVDFNPNSPAQVVNLLFTMIGLPIPAKRTATGNISVDKDVLEELAKLHPIVECIANIKKKKKILNTYIKKLKLHTNMDGRLRTNFNLHTTTSGRLSSSGHINLQQLVKQPKACMEAKEGFKCVYVDLSAAEMYVTAVLSGDKALQGIFKSGGDLHTETAILVFDLGAEAPSDITERKAWLSLTYPELRQSAKAVSFSILYGSGPANVADQVHCSVDQAKEYINAYYKRFPRIKKWIAECHDQILTRGYIYSIFGRKRRVPNVFSSSREIVGQSLRSAFNAIIQSVSSDLMVLAAIDMQNEINTKGLQKAVKPYSLVHDSYSSEVREDLVDWYLERLRFYLEMDRGSSIPGYPIGLDFGVGDTYYEAEYGEKP